MITRGRECGPITAPRQVIALTLQTGEQYSDPSTRARGNGFLFDVLHHGVGDLSVAGTDWEEQNRQAIESTRSSLTNRESALESSFYYTPSSVFFLL